MTILLFVKYKKIICNRPPIQNENTQKDINLLIVKCRLQIAYPFQDKRYAI